MSPKEVIELHREMTQPYHEPASWANAAFAMLISLLLFVVAFLWVASVAGWDEPTTGGPPFYDNSFAAYQRAAH